MNERRDRIDQLNGEIARATREVHLLRTLDRASDAASMAEVGRITVSFGKTTDTAATALGVRPETLYPPPLTVRYDAELASAICAAIEREVALLGGLTPVVH